MNMKPDFTVETFTADARMTGQPFYFRIRARNGRVVAQSEGYATERARDKTALKMCIGWWDGPRPEKSKG
jgi:hypothetical protein